jgi:hypothetical protein
MTSIGYSGAVDRAKRWIHDPPVKGGRKGCRSIPNSHLTRLTNGCIHIWIRSRIRFSETLIPRPNQ